jgi:hypothetical protein
MIIELSTSTFTGAFLFFALGFGRILRQLGLSYSIHFNGPKPKGCADEFNFL